MEEWQVIGQGSQMKGMQKQVLKRQISVSSRKTCEKVFFGVHENLYVTLFGWFGDAPEHLHFVKIY